LLGGEKTSERCSANKSGFSLSLFANGPGGVEYLRIGVMLVWCGVATLYRLPN
jgi:hypothetical protein